MVKDYGVISTIPTTKNLIYEWVETLAEEDQRKFVRKFKNEVASDQVTVPLRTVVENLLFPHGRS